jgi:RNA polymerase sigma-70 factor (ECF subfamily)
MIGKEDFVTQVELKSGSLYRIARSILRSEEDCKDALQEAVLKALANRRKLRDEALFGTWITRIAINECHTMVRRKRKYMLQSVVREEKSAPVPNPELRLLLEQIPEKLRLPLVLHYLEGYTYAQIAALLHIPHSTVRNRLSRARKALHMEMEEEKEARPHENN